MQRLIPVLRILDVTKAKEFYVDWLDFSIDWENRFGENFPLYCQLSKDGIIVHLTKHYGDYIPDARIRKQITGVPALQQQLKEYRYDKPGRSKNRMGLIEMSLQDPVGNHLLFTENQKE